MNSGIANIEFPHKMLSQVGGQAVLGRQLGATTPWLTERHVYGIIANLLVYKFFFVIAK